MTLLRRTPLRARRAAPRKEVPEWKKVPERVGRGKDRGREQCPAFLDFVRSFPCLACRTQVRIEAHHWGKRGKSQLCSDFETVPLCHSCHVEKWHGEPRGLPGRSRKEWRGVFRRVSESLRQLFESLRAKPKTTVRELFVPARCARCGWDAVLDVDTPQTTAGRCPVCCELFERTKE